MDNQQQQIEKQFHEFRRMVFAMREEQARYFKFRSQDALEKARNLERKVDEALKKPIGDQGKPQTLF